VLDTSNPTIERLLTPGWSTTSEPLARGKVKIKAYGCLQVEVKLKGCSRNAQYTIGLNVYGVDLPRFGGLGRVAFNRAPETISGSAVDMVNEYILSTVTTGDTGGAKVKTILPVEPGRYEIQVWVARDVMGAPEAPVVCYKLGTTFGDSETITISEALYRIHTGAPLPIRSAEKRVFLDVGAHTGETVRAVLDPVYRFDWIVCFEPTTACCEQLGEFGDPRITICQFGLWKETAARPLFKPGDVGGSIFSHANDGEAQEMCRFVKAGDWFRENIQGREIVFMKLNCEGSECDIVDDLLDSGEFAKVDFMMIDFDVRRIPSQRHREAEVRSRLAEFRFPKVSFCEEVMVGLTHVARIQNWLRVVGADK
jgi:FkbM family methyltransferase